MKWPRWLTPPKSFWRRFRSARNKVLDIWDGMSTLEKRVLIAWLMARFPDVRVPTPFGDLEFNEFLSQLDTPQLDEILAYLGGMRD